jgi:hypothetical protein
MTNNESIRFEIDKQIAAGFTVDEIRKNLLSQQYSAEDINAAMRQNNVAAKAKSSSGIGIASVLISVYFIFSGIMKMNKYESGSVGYIFGIIMLVAGIGGLIFKLVDISRR